MRFLSGILSLLFLYFIADEVTGAILKHKLIPSRALGKKAEFPHDHPKTLLKINEIVSNYEQKLLNVDEVLEKNKIQKEKNKYVKGGKIKRRSVGNAMLIDYMQDYYLMNISLGTPPQWFLVQPTIFSSDFWVIDSTCTDSVCLGGMEDFDRHRFNKSRSSTFFATDEYVEMEYEYDANIVSDWIRVGGLGARTKFALAYELENWVYYEPMDGLLGLGSFPGDFESVNPVMQTLKEKMDDPVFTIYVQQELTDNDHNGGQITFGAQDSDNCEGDWTYTWVNNHTYLARFWEFQVNGFTVTNSSTTMDNHRRRPAVIRMGFPFILGPAGNVKTIAETAGFTFSDTFGAWIAKCDKIDTMPDVQLKVGGSMLTLKTKQIIKLYKLGGVYGDVCALRIIGFENSGNGPAWHFGDMFLRAFCTSFEISDGNVSNTASNSLRVGFAKAIQPDKKSNDDNDDNDDDDDS